MNILVISNMYPETGSSFGNFVYRQVCELEKHGLHIKKIVKSKKSRSAYLWFVFRIAFDLLVKRSSYEIVHAHYGFHSAFIPAAFKRHPLVLTFHGSDALIEPFKNKFYYMLQRFVIHRADMIIAVSRDIKENIVARLGGDSRKIEVISCGVDVTRFRPMDKQAARKELGIGSGAKIVFFVGKLEFGKGVDILYACARQLSDVTFFLAGEGSYKCDLPNCRFLGHVANDDLPKWLNTADLLVLPSRSEGTPVVILEAFACGLPVVASDVGGIPDIVVDSRTGYLLPMKAALKKTKGATNNVPEAVRQIADVMAEKILAIVENSDTSRFLSKNARSMAANILNNDFITENIINVYRKILLSNRKVEDHEFGSHAI